VQCSWHQCPWGPMGSDEGDLGRDSFVLGGINDGEAPDVSRGLEHEPKIHIEGPFQLSGGSVLLF